MLENVDVGVIGDEKLILIFLVILLIFVVLFNSLFEIMSYVLLFLIYDLLSELIFCDFYGFFCGIVMVYLILFYDFCGCIFWFGVCCCFWYVC